MIPNIVTTTTIYVDYSYIYKGGHFRFLSISFCFSQHILMQLLFRNEAPLSTDHSAKVL